MELFAVYILSILLRQPVSSDLTPALTFLYCYVAKTNIISQKQTKPSCPPPPGDYYLWFNWDVLSSDGSW